MISGFNTLEKEKVIEHTENSVSLEFTIPPSNLYFDGHFPGFPILPAVAQTELVVRFASRYLGTNIALSGIKKMKFLKLIRPSFSLLLKIQKNKNGIGFILCSPQDEQIVYSQGTINPAVI